MPLPATADLRPALAARLAALAREWEACREPWWLIGSAAMATHGAAVEVRDIDVLMAPADAAATLSRRGLPAAPGTPSPLFASDIFCSLDEPPYRIELFAGFRLGTAGGWRRLVPDTREARELGGATLFVPSVDELIAWGRLFNRDKDRAREPALLVLHGRSEG